MARRHIGLCILFSGQPLPINPTHRTHPSYQKIYEFVAEIKVVVGVFNIRKGLHESKQIQNNTSSSLHVEDDEKIPLKKKKKKNI
jgi:hypothetical protein